MTLRRRSAPFTLALVVGLVAGLILSAGGVAQAAPVTPAFGPAIDALAAYDGQDTCDPTAKPGAVGLRDLLEQTYPATTPIAIGRDCSVGGTSEHKEGRAYDWGVNSLDPAQKAMADDLLAWLLATDQHGNVNAMARRLGIMYAIWNGKVWKSYGTNRGWQTYTGSNPHTGHVHFSLNWDGAYKRTSWWAAQTASPSAPETVAGAAVASMSSNRMDLFKKGADGALWHKTFVDSWTGWVSLGGGLRSEPAAVSWGENRIDVFVRGLDDALWHRRFDGAWSGWESLGGALTSGPTVSSTAPGRLEVFARGLDNALHHRRYDGSWSGWLALGGTVTSDPAAVSWGSNRIDLFARGTDMALWHRWWNGSSWSGWQSLGGALTSAPSVSSWGADQLDVFARGTDNALWQRRWGGSWSGWTSLGGALTSGPGSVSRAANLADVFVRGTDNGMWQRSWDGSWRSWASLGATP